MQTQACMPAQLDLKPSTAQHDGASGSLQDLYSVLQHSTLHDMLGNMNVSQQLMACTLQAYNMTIRYKLVGKLVDGGCGWLAMCYGW